MPEMLNSVRTKNYDFWDISAPVETGIAKSMTDGHWLDSRDLSTRGMLQVGNVSQEIENCAKDAFLGLEAQDLNQVLETACARLCTLSMTVHSCG